MEKLATVRSKSIQPRSTKNEIYDMKNYLKTIVLAEGGVIGKAKRYIFENKPTFYIPGPDSYITTSNIGKPSPLKFSYLLLKLK